MAHNYMNLIPVSDIDRQFAQSFVKFICDHGTDRGKITLQNCIQQGYPDLRPGSREFNLEVQKLRNKLVQFPTLFRLTNDSRSEIIELVAKVEICEKHCDKNQGCQLSQLCDKLHICKFYMVGSCRFGKPGAVAACHYGHDLKTPHNHQVLVTCNLDLVEDQTVKDLMKINRTEITWPRICKFYNNQGCRHGGAGGKCGALHVCRYYILDSCTFGKNCKRSHDIFSPQPMAILEHHGISTSRSPKEVLVEMREVLSKIMEGNSTSSATSGGSANSSHDQQYACFPRGGRPSSGTRVKSGFPNAQSTQHGGARPKFQPPLNPATPPQNSATPAIEAVPEICTYNLRGRCGYGDKCHKFHSDQPYQWQTREPGGLSWETVAEDVNQHLEAQYCNPSVKSCPLKNNAHVDMKTLQLKQGGLQVGQLRRLATLSSVTAPKHHKFTTQWIWWWLDNGKKWTEYNFCAKSDDHMVTSDFLEEQYQKNNSAMISFSTDDFSYELDFGTMTQKNKRIGTKREVCRRPQDWSALDDDSDQEDSDSSPTETRKKKYSKAVAKIPAHWDIKFKGSNDFYQLVPVIHDPRHPNKEFTDVEALFQKTMPGIPISKLSRIQNLELWEFYERKKNWMQKRGQKLNEKTLFHGTEIQYVDAICQQGFDWRVSGLRSGAVYGKGSYFARDANFSQQYSTCRKMFVVRVLVGEYCKGHSTYTRPPPKDPSKPNENLYDSCVDHTHDPKIYVMFKQEQSYPEYLVEY